MRLYQFKKSDGTIDVTVTTDGSKDQKRVFITATPTGKGYKVSGKIPEASGAIQELGFNFVNGTTREHQDFVNFATSADLELIQWSGGLGETSPIVLVPAGGLFEYTLSATSPVNFVKAGETKAITIVSTKQKIKNGVPTGAPVDVTATLSISTGSATFSVSNKNVTAKVNAGDQEVLGTVIVKQDESDKTVEVALIQAGA